MLESVLRLKMYVNFLCISALHEQDFNMSILINFIYLFTFLIFENYKYICVLKYYIPSFNRVHCHQSMGHRLVAKREYIFQL
jgi:hypothetical protein